MNVCWQEVNTSVPPLLLVHLMEGIGQVIAADLLGVLKLEKLVASIGTDVLHHGLMILAREVTQHARHTHVPSCK